MDTQDLLGGEDWERAINKAIKRSDFFILCLTKNSVDRRGVMQKEIGAAFDKKKEMLVDDIYLFPIRFEECEVKDERLSKFHRIDLFKNDGYDRLKNTLNEGLKRRELPTRRSPPSPTTIFEDIRIVDDTENVERIDGGMVKVSYNLSAEPPQGWKAIFKDWIRPGESPLFPSSYDLKINDKQVVIKFISLKTTKEEIKRRVEDRIKHTNEAYREELRQKARNAQGSQKDRRKNDEIAAQADQVIREACIELSRRRQEAQKSGKQPDEVICPRHDLSGYLPEKHETRTKIYDYLIKKNYIKLDDSTHELYCFVLTDSGKEYARVELFPEFEGKYERR